MEEKKIHCANIVLYLGSAIALPMIKDPSTQIIDASFW
jgi:hypothetical protein